MVGVAWLLAAYRQTHCLDRFVWHGLRVGGLLAPFHRPIHHNYEPGELSQWLELR